jgi:hypothetical protein
MSPMSRLGQIFWVGGRGETGQHLTYRSFLVGPSLSLDELGRSWLSYKKSLIDDSTQWCRPHTTYRMLHTARALHELHRNSNGIRHKALFGIWHYLAFDIRLYSVWHTAYGIWLWIRQTAYDAYGIRRIAVRSAAVCDCPAAVWQCTAVCAAVRAAVCRPVCGSIW